ncbi:hypothetical protein RVBP17_0690 [Pseudomonas phage sp. 30-3]|uniref:Uncharacterized protein n=1 Tax=Pseudomonas phage vB_PaeM_PA5oct TaxID=2163605 RepID=A0A4Y1LUH5_9CAUD|nr:hypothetical protein PQE65_gp325 [Pseudomonas phage vB_PaeM_PA5oct]WMI32107.1 hypothetical protein GBBBJNDB_00416 [Pseudomonas phage Callisto]WPK39152.1 hypothetical protein Cassandra_0476 [Pseudomonas phage Cassandra]WPK39664.1 hypothetical protein Deiofobo_0467 [Pseudomonas phage Deifobo]WPK40185.1 hypothetical protein ETTORE_0476 [Pseudomonas phage Ettore]WPK40700.1 hypothetical protein Paride_0470 [Pseudomonas phage Paride]VOH56264.1 carbohydrate binding domain protein [Pseudomonas pha
MKTIGVDYDDTISQDDNGWLSVLLALEHIGYRVVIVTYRNPTCYPEDLQFLIDKGYKVYFTSQHAKRTYMENLGIDIDIWIDDSPESILYNYDSYLGKYIK